MEQVAQRDCPVSVPGDIQQLSEHDIDQSAVLDPSWNRGVGPDLQNLINSLILHFMQLLQFERIQKDSFSAPMLSMILSKFTFDEDLPKRALEH